MARAKVTPIRVPEELLRAVDAAAGRGRRSSFFVEAARRELARVTQSAALQESAGAWAAAGHPELPNTVEGLSAVLSDRRAREERDGH